MNFPLVHNKLIATESERQSFKSTHIDAAAAAALLANWPVAFNLINQRTQRAAAAPPKIKLSKFKLISFVFVVQNSFRSELHWELGFRWLTAARPGPARMRAKLYPTQPAAGDESVSLGKLSREYLLHIR